MKLKKNSINNKIWSYLILFSIAILIFLWIFQIICLPSYYEYRKTKDMKKIITEITTTYTKSDLLNEYLKKLDIISFQNGICIEVSDGINNLSYTNDFNRQCMKSIHLKDFKTKFINNNQAIEKYITVNPEFENKTLIYGLKIDTSLYLFVSTSLAPIEATVSILHSQFIIIAIIVLILALIVSYFISKILSKPIEEINESARKLSKGNYNIDFTTKTDIIEIQELADTLNNTKDELAKTDELRRDLMANVSHDLKTPLTMIKAYAELVRDLTYKNKEKREANLNTIIDEVDRLNTLVNDILSLSTMESKMLILEIETFNLTELIKTIIKRYEIFSTTLEYKFILNTNEEIIIKADKQKLEQVIYNLLNNAINYTGDDKKIYINIIKDKNIKVEITDTGKGIDKNEINLIWNKYYKSNKNHQRNTIGTGLGLAIVKNILELHNFEYGVKSNKNKGTTFYFIIKNFK